ncbi:Asp23/Gls24 family envelope stress response protein [Synoicihabitans lomoniglobus]|uniref:Asp23/Gls24 family envelope stress response protein n=1 Tax=Synoicihabitans lomoniglobus TaxID=2909285 RepID=A0AAF0CII1_9BACT|nr:Asp23/Gls24 family envelope stress response protein [Opitutaceae bacterium LMO-M01]WED65432.1 Asp23/Gls24 family envelope stress response protein [Opitutaceae bacterium LMO-M01]
MQSPEFNPPPRYDDQPDLGDIKINHNVIAGIVRLAALQVNGVAGVGGGIVDGIGEIFTKKEADHRGVRVNESENGEYDIEVRLIVAYGSEIGQTAYEVQVDVRKQVMAMTGKEVRKVDVIIEGVRLPGEKPGTDDELWPTQQATD